MIVCFGSASIDLFVRAERLPSLGETVSGSRFARAFGGKGANQIVQAALLGGRCRFVGRVGNSSDGADIARNLSRLGVDVSLLDTSDAEPPGVALIEVEEHSGANRIVVVPGANARLLGAHLDAAALSEAAFLLLQLEIPLSAVLHALDSAPKTVKTVLNPSPVPERPEDRRALVERFGRVHFWCSTSTRQSSFREWRCETPSRHWRAARNCWNWEHDALC